ncbi:MAG: hypothetical protein J6S91_05705 [Treponema sp.]|nr:hypothetical protein [Treponema sp.]
MALVEYTLNSNAKPTEEQIAEVRAATKKSITYDNDSPEFTDEQYAEFARQAATQREERKRQVVSLRLLPQTLEKARKFGKGYTAILSRMIDLCIDDKELLQKCL